MGFLSLIPADKVDATYLVASRLLILHAVGEKQNFTTGIELVRDPHFVGGLKFNLEGWVGPIGPGKEPYNYSQEVPIVLPNAVMSGKEIVIATENYPNGQVVKVRWIWGDRDSPQEPDVGDLSISDDKTLQSPPLSQPPASVDLPRRLVVVYGVPFEIKAGEGNKGGSVSIRQNPRFLTLTDAKIKDGQVIWTFIPLEIGFTQAIVTSVVAPPAIGTFIATYDIEIIGRNVSDIPPSVTDGKESGQPNEILSFLGRVFIAERIVKRTWPEAELWEVDCHLPKGIYQPTTDPLDLSQLQAIWRVDKGTVMIDSNGWGTWNKPVFYPYAYGECVIIPFPVKMDIIEAFRLLQKAGYTKPFGACTLRHPLGPPDQPWDAQPYYIFELGNFGPMIYVGVNDGSVWPPNLKIE